MMHYAILHAAVAPALDDFGDFVELCASMPNDLPEDFDDEEL